MLVATDDSPCARGAAAHATALAAVLDDRLAAGDVDLVATGTHGRTGLDRRLVGSVTERAVRLLDAPVLSVYAGDD